MTCRLFTALALAMTARATIVSDGGFESALVNPARTAYTGSLGDGFWDVTQGSIQIDDAATGEGAVPHSGNHFAYLDFGNALNTLSQTLTTVSGQSYLVSYWVADNAPNSLVVNFGDQNLFTGVAPTGGVGASTDYVNQMLSVVADSTSMNLTFSGQFVGGDGAYGTILDDVSVTAEGTPEPAPLAFTALGLVILWLIPRRLLRTPAPRD
jgi:hypothetical protein